MDAEIASVILGDLAALVSSARDRGQVSTAGSRRSSQPGQVATDAVVAVGAGAGRGVATPVAARGERSSAPRSTFTRPTCCTTTRRHHAYHDLLLAARAPAAAAGPGDLDFGPGPEARLRLRLHNWTRWDIKTGTPRQHPRGCPWRRFRRAGGAEQGGGDIAVRCAARPEDVGLIRAVGCG